MKKILKMLLAAALLFSLGAGALAEDAAGLIDEQQAVALEAGAEPAGEESAAVTERAPGMTNEQALALYNETKAIFGSKTFTVKFTTSDWLPGVYTSNGGDIALEAKLSVASWSDILEKSGEKSPIGMAYLYRFLLGNRIRAMITPNRLIMGFPGRFFGLQLSEKAWEAADETIAVTNVYQIANIFSLPAIAIEDITVTEELMRGEYYDCVSYNAGEGGNGKLYCLNGEIKCIDGWYWIDEISTKPTTKYFGSFGMLKLPISSLEKTLPNAQAFFDVVTGVL